MRIFFSIVLCTLSGHLSAIDFSNLNTSYWYEDNPEIDVRFAIAQFEDQVHVFVEITADSISANKFRFLHQRDFEDPNHVDPDNIRIDTLMQTSGRIIVKLVLEISERDVIVVHCETPKFNFYFPHRLTKGGIPYPDFYLTTDDGLPLFERALSGNPFDISFIDEARSLYFLQYREDFPAADPPMAEPVPVAMTIQVDSMFRQSSDFTLVENHFYFIQTDTLTNQAISIYNGPRYFPRYRTIETLVTPLKYVTRLSEYGVMINSPQLKNSFDKFWITTFSSKQRARNAIREYYRKVAIANDRFTHYKPGWKTDRGIIRIVYGQPLEVYRSDTNEIWVYTNGIEFEFRILSNLFTPELYVLKRQVEYRESWISRVRAFRDGS